MSRIFLYIALIFIGIGNVLLVLLRDRILLCFDLTNIDRQFSGIMSSDIFVTMPTNNLSGLHISLCNSGGNTKNASSLRLNSSLDNKFITLSHMKDVSDYNSTFGDILLVSNTTEPISTLSLSNEMATSLEAKGSPIELLKANSDDNDDSTMFPTDEPDDVSANGISETPILVDDNDNITINWSESNDTNQSDESYGDSNEINKSSEDETLTKNVTTASDSSPRTKGGFRRRFVSRYRQGEYEEEMRLAMMRLVRTDKEVIMAAKMEKKIKSEKAKGIVFESIFQDKSKQAICNNCRLFVGDQEIVYTTQYPFHYNENRTMSVTIVAAATSNRIRFIPFLVKRWEGYFSLSIQIKYDEELQVISKLKSMSLPPRVQVILYVVKKGDEDYYQFPVNKLRNIAIVNIKTTHFLVLDMDMWPSENLLGELLSIPRRIRDSSYSVVIVPAFFLKKEPILNRCKGLLSCARLSERQFPKSRKELSSCIKSGKCLIYKENTVTHRYINSKWFKLPSKPTAVRVNCFVNRFQEPYLLVKYNKHTVLFDERFVDYGCNKVQYIDFLRHFGYKFYILSNSFAMDIVHHDSVYRVSYIKSLHNGEAPNMRLLCHDYQMQLKELFHKTRNQTKLCSNIYTPLYVSR